MKNLANSYDVTSITERLRRVLPSDVARWGCMSSSEMICHLRGSFRMAMGEISPGTYRKQLSPSILKFLALRVPYAWPKNYDTVSALKRDAPDMLVTNFDADLNCAVVELNRFCMEHQHRVDHPYMGSMSTSDWMRWGYLHTDHHLRQFGR